MYLHWPFCPYRCHFCPFIAYAGRDPLMSRYHYALMRELERYAREQERGQIETIFIGGGTPSTWPDELLLDMAGTLEGLFKKSPKLEMSIEVNPGTVRLEQLPLWRSAGINRMSIGVQSLNEGVLQQLNRHQSTQQVVDLLEAARHHFDNISVDLIIGLPGVTDDQWRSLISGIGQWPIQHVSVYFLTVHEGTALAYRVQSKDIFLPADDAVVDLYLWTVATLAEQGFEQYEISNFARPGFRSRHNSAYWKRTPYRGFGVGAWSFDGSYRFANVRTIEEYLQRMERDQDVIETREQLSSEQIWLETVMLALRQRAGIAHTVLFKWVYGERMTQLASLLEQLMAAGHVNKNVDHYQLTPSGLAMANEIVIRLVEGSKEISL
jgi:oxygen-independent coproporphyrinogen-3 oxidase